MCEASVYILADGQEKLLLDSVDIVEPREGGKLYIQNLVGEQTTITARIKRIRLLEHKIIIEKTDEG